MHLKEGGEVLCQRTLVAKMHDSIYIAEIIISGQIGDKRDLSLDIKK